MSVIPPAARQLNELRFQYAYAAFYGYPSGTTLFTDIGSFPASRTDRQTTTFVFPSLTYGSSYDDASPESRWEIKDTYTVNLSNHDLKFGGEYDRNAYKVDDAIGLLKGTFTFAQDQPFNPNDRSSIANLKPTSRYVASTATKRLRSAISSRSVTSRTTSWAVQPLQGMVWLAASSTPGNTWTGAHTSADKTLAT